jgi:hypothetical protein
VAPPVGVKPLWLVRLPNWLVPNELVLIPNWFEVVVLPVEFVVVLVIVFVVTSPEVEPSPLDEELPRAEPVEPDWLVLSCVVLEPLVPLAVPLVPLLLVCPYVLKAASIIAEVNANICFFIILFSLFNSWRSVVRQAGHTFHLGSQKNH